MKPHTSRIYPAIEHKGKLFEDHPGVCNAFAKYFCELYNPVEDISDNLDCFQAINNTNDKIDLGKMTKNHVDLISEHFCSFCKHIINL